MSFDPFGYDPTKPRPEGVQPTPGEGAPQPQPQPQPTGSVQPPADGTAPVPYQGDMQPTGDPARARERAQLPGIFLIVLGVLNLVWVLAVGFYGFIFSSLTPERWAALVAQMPPEQRAQFDKMEADLAKQGMTFIGVMRAAGTFFLVTGGVALLASVFIIIGGVLMVQLRGFGFCVFAAILTAVPLVSGPACCCLGEAVGIWALVVLLSNDVRMAFR
ncbi:MAG: hypothetical protein K2W96_20855 [Gemmataceae bacterium]|nr:hypothetical protein [Gemmataceae bacterium]